LVYLKIEFGTDDSDWDDWNNRRIRCNRFLLRDHRGWCWSYIGDIKFITTCATDCLIPAYVWPHMSEDAVGVLTGFVTIPSQPGVNLSIICYYERSSIVSYINLLSKSHLLIVPDEVSRILGLDFQSLFALLHS